MTELKADKKVKIADILTIFEVIQHKKVHNEAIHGNHYRKKCKNSQMRPHISALFSDKPVCSLDSKPMQTPNGKDEHQNWYLVNVDRWAPHNCQNYELENLLYAIVGQVFRLDYSDLTKEDLDYDARKPINQHGEAVEKNDEVQLGWGNLDHNVEECLARFYRVCDNSHRDRNGNERV